MIRISGTPQRDPTLAALVLIALLGNACESGTEPPEEFKLQIVSGSDQLAGSESPLPLPVVISVLRKAERPVANAEVRWRVIEGGGTVSDVVSRSDSLGLASVRWTLGTDLGQQLLLATSGNASVTIRATANLQFSSVAAGFRHTCALSTGGQAFCWGANPRGQLGDGTATSSNLPVRVRSPIRFKQLATGWSHTCGVSQIDESFCWGDNTVGQLGTGPPGPFQAMPVATAAKDAIVAITAGFLHTCGVTQSGDVLCWGLNEQGQLGGSQPNSVRIPGMRFRSVTASEFHTCGVRSDSTAVCWGWNSTGELGSGAGFGAVVPTPTQVAGTVRFTSTTAGVRHTCAISTDTRVYCWGRSSSGEIGQIPNLHAGVPALVSGTAGFTALGTGNTHTCGIARERAYCWGSLLGDGTTVPSLTPVLVSSSLVFTAIAVGYEHTCGVAGGEVYCWGSNSHGQIGHPSIVASLTPVRVSFPGS